ncbi:hypothetical protein [Nostoc sp. DedQUE07]|uniref:hypothetical protein n=1 Tax=Nostoc sp. DedQUE07 TaxID=3075392 RepID=UPI002AD36F74|nr:hypothetical protein [Nostoc sp. DedQUE07]MDZ8131952.1 hypothetical protein [Nostoc sp. DedQUE07]
MISATQPQNPQPPQAPQSLSPPGQTSAQQPVQMQTKAGKRTERILKSIWEPMNSIGQSISEEFFITSNGAIAFNSVKLLKK